MAAMLHARNNTILFLWDKMFILMQNIFIVPAMQHGRHAKPLYSCSHSQVTPSILSGFPDRLLVPMYTPGWGREVPQE